MEDRQGSKSTTRKCFDSSLAFWKDTGVLPGADFCTSFARELAGKLDAHEEKFLDAAQALVKSEGDQLFATLEESESNLNQALDAHTRLSTVNEELEEAKTLLESKLVAEQQLRVIERRQDIQKISIFLIAGVVVFSIALPWLLILFGLQVPESLIGVSENQNLLLLGILSAMIGQLFASRPSRGEKTG